MQKSIIRFTILATSILATGCASFQAHKLPVVQANEHKVTNTEKIKLFSRWKFESTSSVINRDAAAAIHKAAFEKAIKTSGCCDIVEGPSEASLIIDGTAIDHSDMSVVVPAFFTGLSLYTIPSWVTETIDLKVNISKGNKKETYELDDSFVLVQWLPMLFAFPFTGGPGKNSEELYANTHKSLVVQLKRDGYLNQ